MNDFVPGDISDIKKLLPHTYPMLLLDKIKSFSDDLLSGVGIKCVTINEEYFCGHFPHNPIMPGVLIVESVAQTACYLIMNYLRANNKKVGNNIALTGLNKVKFRSAVRPGDVLENHVNLSKSRKGFYYYDCVSYVENKISAELSFSALNIDHE